MQNGDYVSYAEVAVEYISHLRKTTGDSFEKIMADVCDSYENRAERAKNHVVESGVVNLHRTTGSAAPAATEGRKRVTFSTFSQIS